MYSTILEFRFAISSLCARKYLNRNRGCEIRWYEGKQEENGARVPSRTIGRITFSFLAPYTATQWSNKWLILILWLKLNKRHPSDCYLFGKKKITVNEWLKNGPAGDLSPKNRKYFIYLNRNEYYCNKNLICLGYVKTRECPAGNFWANKKADYIGIPFFVNWCNRIRQKLCEKTREHPVLFGFIFRHMVLVIQLRWTHQEGIWLALVE